MSWQAAYHKKKKLHEKRDFFLNQAINTVPKIVAECRVVTDREIKVRLEGEPFPKKTGPFPWVTGYAIQHLLNDNVLKNYGYVGRRRIKGGVTNKYYCTFGTPYSEVKDIIQLKRRVSADFNMVLTGTASAGFHAEDVFLEAFEKIGFNCVDRNVSEFNGKTASGIKGKKLPDIDFLLERNGFHFGVDIKNWIRYEYETPLLVRKKLKVCEELDLIPFIVARYIDRSLTNEIIYGLHGIVYEYKSLILQSSFNSLAENANNLLGYPVLAIDSLPDNMTDTLENIWERFFATKT